MLSDELPPLPDYLSPGTVHEYARAVERAAYERAAIAAWTAGMKEHNRRGGMPYDCREVGSVCAAAVRALKEAA